MISHPAIKSAINELLLVGARYLFQVWIATIWMAGLFSSSVCAEPGESVKYIPAVCDNMLIVGDIFPHLERSLASDRFQRVFGSLPFADMPGAETPLNSLKRVEHYFPTEIVVGMPADSLAQLVAILRMYMLSSLAQGASSVGDAEYEQQFPGLQNDFLSALKKFKLPRATIWCEFRNNSIPWLLMVPIQQAGASMRDEFGASVTQRDSFLGIMSKVQDFISTGDLRDVLAELGVISAANDSKAREMIDAIASVTLEFSVEMRGSGFLITLGSFDQESKLQVSKEQLGPLWTPTPDLALFGRWNLGPFMEKLVSLQKLWQAWENTPTGKAVESFDDEDLIGDMKIASRQLGRLGTTGSLRATIKDAIEVVVHEHGLEATPSIHESGLDLFVPAGAEVVILDSTRSIADHFSDVVSGFEERLVNQEIKHEVRGNESQLADIEQIVSFFYGKLDKFRQLIHHDLHPSFNAPVGIVINTQATLASAGVVFESPAGHINRFTGRNLPAIEYATIGRVRDSETASHQFNETWSAFLDGFIDDVPDTLVKEIDLGFRHPAYSFTSDFWRKVPGNISVSIEGDLQPHYLFVDDWMIFSTSPSLTRRILNCRNGSGARHRLPVDESQRVVGYGKYSIEPFAVLIARTSDLTKDFFSTRNHFTLEGNVFPPPDEEFAERMSELQMFMAELVRLVGVVEWISKDHTEYRETQLQVLF